MGFNCTTCGEYHERLPMCFGPPAPALWMLIPEAERARRGELSSDQCVIDDEHFFVLGRIVLPVVDGPEPFCWLAWVSLSEKNFLRASELWHTEGRESEPPYFGWLQSKLPYDPSTLCLKTNVITQAVGERPLIELQPTEHPLSVEQRNGITMARVQEIVEAALHDELARRKDWFEEYTSRLDRRSTELSLRCPCCLCKTLSERAGFEICEVCFWEDDGQDDHDADAVRGGPNGALSLTQARANYRRIGACDPRSLAHVRPPRSDELPDDESTA